MYLVYIRQRWITSTIMHHVNFCVTYSSNGKAAVAKTPRSQATALHLPISSAAEAGNHHLLSTFKLINVEL